MPSHERIDDPLGFAQAVFAYDMELAGGARGCVAVAVPLHVSATSPPADLARSPAAAWADVRLAETIAHWRTRLGRVPIELPRCAEPFSSSLRASLAWILVKAAFGRRSLRADGTTAHRREVSTGRLVKSFPSAPPFSPRGRRWP